MELPTLRSEEFTEEFMSRQQPCLIVDALAAWPAMTRWSPQYLTEVCRDKPVRVTVGALDRRLLDFAQNIPSVPFRLAADWIANSENLGRTYYVAQANLQDFPELMDDVRFEQRLGVIMTNLWFGPARTATPLHFDSGPNMFAQIYGSKRFTLFEPDQSRFFHLSEQQHISAVDVDRPNLEVHPLFAQAHGFRVTVDAGNALFIPPYWWHHVVANEISISVNQWWLGGLGAARGTWATQQIVRDYRQNRWAGHRQGQAISRRQLVRIAEKAVHENLVVAVLAVSVVLQELDVWPAAQGANARQWDPLRRKQLDAMVDAVLNGREAELQRDDVATLVDSFRAFEAESEVWLSRVVPDDVTPGR